MPARRKLTDADQVWNRACYREGNHLREADTALGALLLVHGYIMNGGVCHAFDLDPEELTEGLKGYTYFALHDLHAIIMPHEGDKEGEYNTRYYDFFRGQKDPIVDRFNQMFRDHPERFAPLI